MPSFSPGNRLIEIRYVNADGECRRRRRFQKDRIGLFILRPGLGATSESALLKLDKVIDRLEWMFRTQDMALGVRKHAADLVQDIAEWVEASGCSTAIPAP